MKETCEVELLKKIGISNECLQVYKTAPTDAAKIMILKRWRCKLLEQIHDKQTLLDQIDYLIHCQLRQEEKK